MFSRLDAMLDVKFLWHDHWADYPLIIMYSFQLRMYKLNSYHAAILCAIAGAIFTTVIFDTVPLFLGQIMLVLSSMLTVFAFNFRYPLFFISEIQLLLGKMSLTKWQWISTKQLLLVVIWIQIVLLCSFITLEALLVFSSHLFDGGRRSICHVMSVMQFNINRWIFLNIVFAF